MTILMSTAQSILQIDGLEFRKASFVDRPGLLSVSGSVGDWGVKE